jgi:hypothetical protein
VQIMGRFVSILSISTLVLLTSLLVSTSAYCWQPASSAQTQTTTPPKSESKKPVDRKKASTDVAAQQTNKATVPAVDPSTPPVTTSPSLPLTSPSATPPCKDTPAKSTGEMDSDKNKYDIVPIKDPCEKPPDCKDKIIDGIVPGHDPCKPEKPPANKPDGSAVPEVK